MDEVFHEGQLAVQKITKEEDIAKMRIPMAKSMLHPRCKDFKEHQMLAFLGTENSKGALW